MSSFRSKPGSPAGSVTMTTVADQSTSPAAPSSNEQKNGRHLGYSTDTDSSAGSGRGRSRKRSSSKRSYRKNGYNNYPQQQQQQPPNGIIAGKNGYNANTAAAALKRNLSGSAADDEGTLPSHLGLVQSVLGSAEAAGYDSGSVGGGGMKSCGTPGSISDAEGVSGTTAVNVAGSSMSAAAVTNALSVMLQGGDGDLSESQEGGNSDRDREFQSYRDRDIDVSSQADTSQCESQADTSQDGYGYHSETGAMSDGNSISAPRHNPHQPISRSGSIGGMSRSSTGAGSTSNDRPPDKVVMIKRPAAQAPPMPPMVVGPGAAFHSLEQFASLHHSFPPSSAAGYGYGGAQSDAGSVYKSDNATACSGSMVDDIDMASIMSGDGSIVIGDREKSTSAAALTSAATATTTTTATAFLSPNPGRTILSRARSDQRTQDKHDVTFAKNASVYEAHRPWLDGQDHDAFASSKPHAKTPPPPATIAVNDMGPPLKRSIVLERVPPFSSSTSDHQDIKPSGTPSSGQSIASASDLDEDVVNTSKVPADRPSDTPNGLSVAAHSSIAYQNSGPLRTRSPRTHTRDRRDRSRTRKRGRSRSRSRSRSRDREESSSRSPSPRRSRRNRS